MSTPRNRFIRPLARATQLAILLGTLTPPAQAVMPAPGPLATSLVAAEGYAYGFPLVLMAETLAASTGPTRTCGQEGNVNEFMHLFSTPGPEFRTVVRPNVDTLYSNAFLDLRQGPQLLEMPAVSGRYVLMALLDAWSNNFAGLGTPSHGDRAGRYMIAGPGWAGPTPSGYTRVDSPTNLVWVIGRTELRGPEDAAAVNAIQRQYVLRPLSGVRPASETTCTPRAAADTPPAMVNRLSAVEFFSRLSRLMAVYPPPAADQAMLRKLGTIGVGPGAQRDVSTMPLRTQWGLEAGKSMAQTTSDLGLTVLGRTSSWTPDPSRIPLGDYGQQHLVRYVVAQVGFGANRNDLAVYQNAIQDQQFRLLNGAQRAYSITFPAGQLPPVDAFWSVTVYDGDGYLSSNPLRRYALGSNTPLQKASDGSLTLHLSHQPPSNVPASNWLPVPDGPFEVTVRLYGPRPEILDGSWRMPPIRGR